MLAKRCKRKGRIYQSEGVLMKVVAARETIPHFLKLGEQSLKKPITIPLQQERYSRDWREHGAQRRRRTLANWAWGNRQNIHGHCMA